MRHARNVYHFPNIIRSNTFNYLKALEYKSERGLLCRQNYRKSPRRITGKENLRGKITSKSKHSGVLTSKVAFLYLTCSSLGDPDPMVDMLSLGTAVRNIITMDIPQIRIYFI